METHNVVKIAHFLQDILSPEDFSGNVLVNTSKIPDLKNRFEPYFKWLDDFPIPWDPRKEFSYNRKFAVEILISELVFPDFLSKHFSDIYAFDRTLKGPIQLLIIGVSPSNSNMENKVMSIDLPFDFPCYPVVDSYSKYFGLLKEHTGVHYRIDYYYNGFCSVVDDGLNCLSEEVSLSSVLSNIIIQKNKDYGFSKGIVCTWEEMSLLIQKVVCATHVLAD